LNDVSLSLGIRGGSSRENGGGSKGWSLRKGVFPRGGRGKNEKLEGGNHRNFFFAQLQVEAVGGVAFG